MARVVMQAVVSVDGYIAYPDDTVGPLFDWYGNGDTEVSARASGWTFHVSRASADYIQPIWDAIKVTVIGRHLFDTTNGWDGEPAAGDELVVVTHRPLPEAWLADHPDAPFHTAGSVEAGIALAKKLAGDGLVCVTAGDLGGRCTGLIRAFGLTACAVTSKVPSSMVWHMARTGRSPYGSTSSSAPQERSWKNPCCSSTTSYSTSM